MPVIGTPNISNENCCTIAEVEVFLNIYGNIVISAENHDGEKGYWSESLDYICSELDNDTLEYLLNSLQKEAGDILPRLIEVGASSC